MTIHDGRFIHGLTRALATRLDTRLAAGTGPETGRLLASRAMRLTTRPNRDRLADAWDDVTARASAPSRPDDPRVPVARDSVRAASTEIVRVAELLRSPATLAAGDVARFRLLLTDGTSPVYVDDGSLAATLRRLLVPVETVRSTRAVAARHERTGGMVFGGLTDHTALPGNIEYTRRLLS